MPLTEEDAEVVERYAESGEGCPLIALTLVAIVLSNIAVGIIRLI